MCLLLAQAMDALAASPLGWLCMGVTVLFGATVLRMAKRSPVEKGSMLLWSLLPALLGLLCGSVLGACGGLLVFCGVCLISSMYLGGTAPLPVGDKAVLVTGKVLWEVKTGLFSEVCWKTLCSRVRNL